MSSINTKYEYEKQHIKSIFINLQKIFSHIAVTLRMVTGGADPRSGNPAILSAITQIFSIQSMRLLKVILKEFLTSKDTADEKYFYNLQSIKRNQN